MMIFVYGSSRAQLLASVVLPASVKDTGFTSTSVSCFGSVCTASFIYDRPGFPEAKIIFKRSNDGGHTWATQDPGLPNLIGENGLNLWKVIQIDSLNAVSFGDSSLVLRTFDGGATWERQSIPVMCPRPWDISFAGPFDGIFIDALHIFITHDGGRNWRLAGFKPSDISSCFAYGGKRFSVFKYSHGNTYSTSDDWVTVDSTGPVQFPPGPTRVLGYCWFSGGDTLIAGGNTLIPVPNDNTRSHPLLVRSTDRGANWSILYEDTMHVRGTVWAMSSINRDTIVAGMSFGRSGVLVSMDHGNTWFYDSLHFSGQDSDIVLVSAYGVDLTGQGELVATMGDFQTSLVSAHFITASVETYHGLKYYSYLYPTVVSQAVRIVSEARLDPVVAFDVLGREVLRDRLDDRGECKLDVSKLAAGVYVIMIRDGAQLLPVSRVVVDR